MKWSEEAWKAIGPIYKGIQKMPFISELINGSLEEEKFLFYLKQDAVYLSDYGKVLTGIAAKLNEFKHVEAFINFAGDSVAMEKELHESFFKDIWSNQTKASPACLLYTSYLMKQLHFAPVEVSVAAVLPCFWIYKEVGDYILANQVEGDNPYQSWIDTYGGEEFAAAVRQAISIADELAEQCTPKQRETMTEAFVMCSRFEWMFWNSAYNKEQWKI